MKAAVLAAERETKPGVPKYETFVEEQLARVRTRIRALDAGRSLLLLGVVTLSYFLVMAAFDLAVQGSDAGLVTGIRLAAFGSYAILVVFFLGQLGLRLYRRINPYYAARQLEETIPDAKNSVINWLDLRGQELPGAIRSAVGQRAARELKQTDPDRAVSPKGNWLLGGILAGLALGLLILFAMGPNQFGSLLRRAFLTPFFTRLDTRTEITLLRPAGGHVTVPLGQRVEFQAQIEGRFPRIGQPGAPRLLYRYQASDSFVPLALDEALDGTWTATLLGDQVQNGFWYKVAAGDKETPEYQVKVQSLPQATRFAVTYHYRPYRKLADDKVVFPNEQAVFPRLKDYRGTEVTLVVRTNRELRGGRFEVESGGAKNDLAAELLPDDPRAMSVHMTLEKRGTFRVLFTSKAGEENTDRSSYAIEVLDDQAPRVVLTKPGEDVSLPPGGTLQLEGSAQDDIGLASLALHLKVLEGNAQPALEPKVYREGKSFQFDDGTYPDFLEYKDFVVLDKMKTARGELFPLQPGMIVEYWLEARDNSDYPSKNGNVGKSQAFKVKIMDSPKDDKKQQEERKKAEEQQKKHEQNQDRQNAKENQKRKDAQANKDPQKDERKKQDFEDKLEKVQKELDKDKKNNDKTESKDQDPKPGESKPGENAENNSAGTKGSENSGQAGEKKDDGKQGQGGQAAQPKGQGTEDQGDKKPSEAKGPSAGEQKSAEAKGNDVKSDAPDKGMAKEQPKEQPGHAKNEGKPSAEKPSTGKGNDAGNPNPSAQTKGNKDGQEGNTPQAKGDNQGTGGNADAKGDKKAGSTEQAAKAQDKGAGQGARPEAGAGKEGPPPQPEPQGVAKGNDEATKAESKTGGQNPQLGKKDGSGKGPDAQATPSKGADPSEAKKSPLAKNDQPTKTNSRDATRQDVSDLKKKLEGQRQGDEAYEKLSRLAKEAKDAADRKAAQEALDKLDQEARANHDELSRMAKEAKDPQVRKDAQDALRELDQHAQANAESGGQKQKGPESPAKASPKDGNQQSPTQAAKSDGPKTGPDTAKGDGDGQVSKKPNGETKPGSKLGNPGPGGTGATDDVTKQDPDAKSAKRGGELQLEDLKKRMTPETLKKLGWSDEDWQKFLRDAEDYQRMLRHRQTATNGVNKKGTTSAIPNSPLREVDIKRNDALDPLQADRALPPPEFREAYRQFTTSPPGKKQ